MGCFQVSEWFSCRYDCPAVYKLSVDLLNENETNHNENGHFDFSISLMDEYQNVWLNVSLKH